MTYTVTLKYYDPQWRPLEWAQRNCPSYATNEAVTVHGVNDDVYYYHIRYHFSNENDAIIFSLRWL